MAKYRTGIRAADRRRQAVPLGDLLDQAGIGTRQILDRNLIGPRTGEIELDPGIDRLSARPVGGRADKASILENKNLEIRGGSAEGLIPLEQQWNGRTGPFGIDRDGLHEA